MLEILLLKIDGLLKEKKKTSFNKNLKLLGEWAKEVKCLYTRGFVEAMVETLRNNKMDKVEAKRLMRKYKKQIRKQIAINDEK